MIAQYFKCVTNKHISTLKVQQRKNPKSNRDTI